MGLDRALPLRVSEKKFFVGFHHAVKVELRDTMDRFPGILKRIMSF